MSSRCYSSDRALSSSSVVYKAPLCDFGQQQWSYDILWVFPRGSRDLGWWSAANGWNELQQQESLGNHFNWSNSMPETPETRHVRIIWVMTFVWPNTSSVDGRMDDDLFFFSDYSQWPIFLRFKPPIHWWFHGYLYLDLDVYIYSFYLYYMLLFYFICICYTYIFLCICIFILYHMLF